MKLKSIISLLCVTGLMAMALAGCGSSSAGTSSAASTASKSASASTSTSSKSSSSEVIGQVQSVSDKTVTLLLGDLTDAGQNQNGAPPQSAGSSSTDASLSSSPNSSQVPSNAQPGQQPSGQQSSDQQSSDQPSKPDGKQPDAVQPGGAKTFTAGTETTAITLTNGTVIKVESVTGETDGSIADVKEGAVLDVTLGDNNAATTVIVKNVMPDNLTAPDHTNAGAPGASSSAAQSTNS
ncbi:hypothetical protein [Oscillibacter sp.]|uniref:hypothetical protein n=1 Tax=Oscillibacter sp. TaxID=1945593 RepID=UPI00339262C5